MFYYDFYGFDFVYIGPAPRRAAYPAFKTRGYPYIPEYPNKGYHVRSPTGRRTITREDHRTTINFIRLPIFTITKSISRNRRDGKHTAATVSGN